MTCNVVGLLEADPIAVVAPHDAAPDRRPEAAIEVNTRTTAAVERWVGRLVPLDDQVLDIAHPGCSYPLTTGNTVAALASAPTMQSAPSGVSIATVLPRRPVIRATVVWKPSGVIVPDRDAGARR